MATKDRERCNHLSKLKLSLILSFAFAVLTTGALHYETLFQSELVEQFQHWEEQFVLPTRRHTDHSSHQALTLPRVLVIYFPQYHPDPLNDKNWGVNFTDWNSLRAAPETNRLGFRIPRPTELGYYDLRDTDIRRRQAELARDHSIDGFIIHHYWFYDPTHPGPNLHAPLMEMLKDSEPDIPFFFNWCAQRWSNVWMGRPIFQNIPTSKNRAIILQEQFFNPTDDMIVAHYDWLKQFFHRPNYIRVGGQPVFMLYQLNVNALPILKRLRELAIQDGFPGIYLTVGRSSLHTDLYPVEEKLPVGERTDFYKKRIQPLDSFPMELFNNTIAYPYAVEWMNESLYVPEWCASGKLLDFLPSPSRESPGVLPTFDNTPRRDRKTSTIWNVMDVDEVVQQFKSSVKAAVYFESCCLPPTAEYDSRFVVINAWNEWAEGMSLEPSDVYGRRFLESVRDAKLQVAKEGCVRAYKYS